MGWFFFYKTTGWVDWAITLTQGVDTGPDFVGNPGGHNTFNAYDIANMVGADKPSWTPGDQIDGGTGGHNVFNVMTALGGGINNPAGSAVTNIQEMNATSFGGAINLNTTEFSGLETLNTNTVATINQSATASATTNVNATLTKGDGGTITVAGGNNVVANATGAAGKAFGNINVGGAGSDAAAGNVVVNATGGAYTASGNLTLGNIAVTGGKTITVNQAATSDATKAATTAVNNTVTEGDITVTANADTTAINVHQDATVAAKNYAKAVDGVAGQYAVTFQSLANGANVSVAGLTFTNNSGRALSGAEVAQAFADLIAGAVKPINATPTTADGDTQSNGVSYNGTYSGSIKDFHTGAADGATIVFTQNVAGTGAAITTGGGISASEVTAGVTAVTGVTGVLGVTAGKVSITGNEALQTVTVDGYGVGSSIANAASGPNTALATLNLANGAGFEVSSAATTLTLNANNVQGTVDIKAGTTTLNADITGNTAKAAAATDLKSASIKEITLTGDGKVSGTNTNLTALTAVDASAFTGTSTFTISGTQTSYAGGSGVDTVKVTSTAAAAANSLAHDINLGAGNDTLDLTGVASIAALRTITGSYDGGEGSDTVILNASQAAQLSDLAINAKTFNAQVTGFEKLGLVNDGGTVNLDNLKYDYIVVNNKDAGNDTLNLTNAKDGITVELNSAQSGTDAVTVAVKGATAASPADHVNVIASNAGATTDFGSFTANNVKTINVTAVDADTTDKIVPTHTLAVSGDKAETIHVDGDANVSLTFSGVGALQLLDASGLTGALTASLGTLGAAVTFQGGSGNDVLTAGSAGGTLIGGSGADTFKINTTGNTAADAHTVIADFGDGADLLQLFSNVSSTVATVSTLTAVTAGTSGTFATDVGTAMTGLLSGQAGWFYYQGNSYVVVQNGDGTTGGGSTGFDANIDTIIELNGVDLNNGFSFNSDFGTIALVG